MIFLLKLVDKLVKQHQLARALQELIVPLILLEPTADLFFHALKHEKVIAAFSELDIDVVQLALLQRILAKLGQQVLVFTIYTLVIGGLERGQAHIDHCFLQWGYRVINFFLQTTQEMRFQQMMQVLYLLETFQ